MCFEGSKLDAEEVTLITAVRVGIMWFNIDVSKRSRARVFRYSARIVARHDGFVDVLLSAILASYITPSDIVVRVYSQDFQIGRAHV